jgi:hypothetical protein
MFILVFLLIIEPSWSSDSFRGQRFFFGDLHVHTGVSGDGESADIGTRCDPNESEKCGSVAEFAQNAQARGLDFAAVTDHINGGSAADSAADFMTVQNIMMASHDPANEFIVVPAAELYFMAGTSQYLGHRNLYLFGDNDGLAKMTLESMRFDEERTHLKDCDAVWEFVEDIQNNFGPALLLPHHVAGSSFLRGDWSCFNQELAPAVEVYSVHGNGMNNSMVFDPFTMPAYAPETTVHDALSLDVFRYKIGFYGSTDNHTSMPGDVCSSPDKGGLPYGGGLAVVVQDENQPFTRIAVRDALVDRRTYATSGPMIPVVVEYYANDEYLGKMGEVLSFPAGASLRAEVTVPEEHAVHVTEVQLLYPEVGVEDPSIWSALKMEATSVGTWEAVLETAPDLFYPMVIVDGDSWYGKGNCDDGGTDAFERIWLSPSWIEWLPNIGRNGAFPEIRQDSGEVDAEDPILIEKTGPVVVTRPTGTTGTTGTTGYMGEDSANECGCTTATRPLTLALYLILMFVISRRRQAGSIASPQ